jgi:hypothetical protein
MGMSSVEETSYEKFESNLLTTKSELQNYSLQGAIKNRLT